MGMLSSLCFPTSWFQEHNRSKFIIGRGPREEGKSVRNIGRLMVVGGKRGTGRSAQVAWEEGEAVRRKGMNKEKGEDKDRYEIALFSTISDSFTWFSLWHFRGGGGAKKSRKFSDSSDPNGGRMQKSHFRLHHLLAWPKVFLFIFEFHSYRALLYYNDAEYVKGLGYLFETK